MRIELPEHITANITEAEVFLDLAVGMYASGRLTIAQAAELAGLPQGSFQRELGRRRIEASYDLDALAEDIAAAAQLRQR